MPTQKSTVGNEARTFQPKPFDMGISQFRYFVKSVTGSLEMDKFLRSQGTSLDNLGDELIEVLVYWENHYIEVYNYNRETTYEIYIEEDHFIGTRAQCEQKLYSHIVERYSK